MGIAGFVTYYWRQDRWVPQRRSQEMAESSLISCDDCGQLHQSLSHEPPFDLEMTDYGKILGR